MGPAEMGRAIPRRTDNFGARHGTGCHPTFVEQPAGPAGAAEVARSERMAPDDGPAAGQWLPSRRLSGQFLQETSRIRSAGIIRGTHLA